MNSFVIISLLVAIASAKPFDSSVSLTQDTAGNYNLDYKTEDASRTEHGTQDGKVVGSYTYTDKEGGSHTIKYVAAPEGGFVASGDIPRPVQETPEVAAVRAAHLQVVAKERALLPPLMEEPIVHTVHHIAPAPAHFVQLPTQHHVVVVDNTAELEAAKAEHFAAHEAALARLANEYRKVTV